MQITVYLKTRKIIEKIFLKKEISMRQPALLYPNNHLENTYMIKDIVTKINILIIEHRKIPVRNKQRVRTNSQKLKYKYRVKNMKRCSTLSAIKKIEIKNSSTH